MPESDERKKILVPVKAGLHVMERYGLFCEAQYTWDDEALDDEVLARVWSGHAPYSFNVDGKKVRVNIASPNDEFRERSVGALEAYIRGATHAPNCRVVVSHPAPHFWPEDAGVECEVREVGVYGLLVESLKRLSKVAAEAGIRFVIENNRVPWHDFESGQTYDHDEHHGKVREYFASTPNEWASLPADVDEPNFGLCLDTSHAVTYAQRFPPAARAGILDLYLALASDRLWHFHWNDNDLETEAGRDDKHFTIGKGTIPKSFHAEVWNYPSARTYVFEHWYDEGALATEMRYVERL